MTTPPAPPTGPLPNEQAPFASRGRVGTARRPFWQRPGGIFATLVVAGSFALWGYAFSGHRGRVPPDTLRDTTYVRDAEAMCRAARADIDALPPAPAASDPLERAEILDIATTRVESLVAGLRTLRPDDELDRTIVERWLTDWDRYVADRRAYAERLRTEEGARFTLTARDGEDYTKSMDRMAMVNGMLACETPGDV